MPSFQIPPGQPLIVASAHQIDRAWVPSSKPSPERVIDCTVLDTTAMDPEFFRKSVATYRSEMLADGTIRLHFSDQEKADTAFQAVAHWLRGLGKSNAVALNLTCPTTSLHRAHDAVRNAALGSFLDMHALPASSAGWTGTVETDEGGRVTRVVLTPGA